MTDAEARAILTRVTKCVLRDNETEWRAALQDAITGRGSFVQITVNGDRVVITRRGVHD